MGPLDPHGPPTPSPVRGSGEGDEVRDEIRAEEVGHSQAFWTVPGQTEPDGTYWKPLTFLRLPQTFAWWAR